MTDSRSRGNRKGSTDAFGSDADHNGTRANDRLVIPRDDPFGGLPLPIKLVQLDTRGESAARKDSMAKRDGTSKVLAAHHPPAPRTQVYRLAVPLMYAGMGVALGTLTGMSLAFFAAPGGISQAFNAAMPGFSSAPDAAVDAGERALWADNTTRAAKIQAAEPSSRGAIADSASADSTTSNSSANRPAKTQDTHETQTFPARTPAGEERAPSSGARAKRHQARPVTRPFAKPAPAVLASAPEVPPEPQENQQLSPVPDRQMNLSHATSSHSYVEGDFTVADFDSSVSTIETNDGRRFVLGTTVRISSAVSWDDYRANVHYRCSDNGTCTLTRAGAITPDARLI